MIVVEPPLRHSATIAVVRSTTKRQFSDMKSSAAMSNTTSTELIEAENEHVHTSAFEIRGADKHFIEIAEFNERSHPQNSSIIHHATFPSHILSHSPAPNEAPVTTVQSECAVLAANQLSSVHKSTTP